MSRQIELLEDSPYLQRANDLANTGDPNSLEAAVAQASRIAQGRALYGEAQTKIQAWIERRQRLEDQPFLERAQQLAARGNLAEALLRWRAGFDRDGCFMRKLDRTFAIGMSQFQGEQGLQSARQAARAGTADALQTAISLPFRCLIRVRSAVAGE